MFSRGLLALFDRKPQKLAPFCIRMRDLFGRCNLPLHGIRQASVVSAPPWKNVRPLIDLSLSNGRKDDVPPYEARSRTMEHISSYEDRASVYTDGSKTSDGVAALLWPAETPVHSRCQQVPLYPRQSFLTLIKLYVLWKLVTRTYTSF